MHKQKAASLSPYPKQMALSGAALDTLSLTGPTFVDKGGVTAVETARGRVWAKTAEMPRRNLNGMILPVISALVPLPILRQTSHGKNGDGLLKQSQRLRQLHNQGLPVAQLLYADDDVMITADGGSTIEKLVRRPDSLKRSALDEATLRQALLDMTRALAMLHRHDTAHGRPKIRDFAWDDGHITILDLEERPWEVMSMADAQARDIFLWLHDLCSAPFSRTLAPEAAALLSETMTDETRERLRRFLNLLRYATLPARGLLRLLPDNRELTAGLGAYNVLREIVR